RPNKLQVHLAKNCNKCPDDIRLKYTNIIIEDENDVSKNPFPKRILRCCNILCRFFKTSHMGGFLLRKYIEEMNISGGSLKTYCETRWTSCYDTVKSVA
ncbi:16776_t:CDS:2, partial [Funneliformis geosporum]